MYRTKAHIHFVGIGGIGMSGIATILRHQGYTISGCDINVEQISIEQLKKVGCIIYHGHNHSGCHDTSIDVVVFSSDISSEHPEITRAQARGIPTIRRALMLAELMRTKFSIAVAGAHGKTTTTSLISHILIQTHQDPTVIIGGHLHTISSNARWGDGDFLVAEADESDRTLEHLQATLALITNIDREHLNTYVDIEDIKKTFLRFLNNLPFYGKAIVCADSEHVRSLLPLPHLKIITYGIDHPAHIYAQNIVLGSDSSTMDVYVQGEVVAKDVIVPIPGIHNALNALGALAMCSELGLSYDDMKHALASFKGVDRRFTYKGTWKGAELFDDYGHHPQEIHYTLLVARKRAKKRLIVVFQPQRYSRTHKLWDDFITVLSQHPVDQLIITDIYPAAETAIAGVNSQKLAAEIKLHSTQDTATYIPYEKDFQSIITYLDSITETDDLVLLLGAGKLNHIVPYLMQSISK